jgi:hypothetical protein
MQAEMDVASERICREAGRLWNTETTVKWNGGRSDAFDCIRNKVTKETYKPFADHFN